MPRILCIIGPTGTGKSQIALSLAKRFGGTIINSDSRQVYRDFPKITDQPGRDIVCHCPHKLYGFLGTWQQINAGQFALYADQAIAASLEQGRLPILVGGTGLYFKAVVHGLSPIPDISQKIRNKVMTMAEEHDCTFLYGWLQKVDPKAGQRIHCHDKQRITRALEVYLATGRPITWWQERDKKKGPRYRALKIGLCLDQGTLYQRLIERIDKMISESAFQEVAQAWKRCPDEEAPGWSAIGCHELLQCLLGRFSLEEAKEEWISRTKAYAKRQMTWFGKEADIFWYNPEQSSKIQQHVHEWLEQK